MTVKNRPARDTCRAVFLADSLKNGFVESDDLGFFYITRIARCASIGHGRVGKEVDVFFLYAQVR